MKSNTLFIIGIIFIIAFIGCMSYVYFYSSDAFSNIDNDLIEGSEEFVISFYFYDFESNDNVTVLTVSEDSDFFNTSFDVLTFNDNYSYEFSMMEQGVRYSMVVEKDFSDDALYFLRFKD